MEGERETHVTFQHTVSKSSKNFECNISTVKSYIICPYYR